MRFDDSLRTILAADLSREGAAAAAWRQLVDLVGRGRIPAEEPVLARLRLLRQAVPQGVRAASARSLAFAVPGASLVGLFAEDDLSVAAPVLRTATLPPADWLAMLPRMRPEGRSVLRHRRDLPPEVVRGLDAFGSTDFVLDHDGDAAAQRSPSVEAVPVPMPAPVPDAPRSPTPFVALGAVARELPVVAEALRRVAPEPDEPAPSRFEIADLVARLDAFNRDRGGMSAAIPASSPVTRFSFDTDATGLITVVDGVDRAAILGVTIAHAVRQGLVGVDAAMSGAFRQRADFTGARLDVDGTSDAAGTWRVAGSPSFDAATGCFTGYRGIARRPRADESAIADGRRAQSESLRQLVHELRTPTNAIMGFAELIESQLLGPVETTYRDHAVTIRDQAAALLAAIDDLDTAARIEGGALDLRVAAVQLDPLLAGAALALEPLSNLRRVTVRIASLGDAAVLADDRALERLLSRLLAALIALAVPGELVAVSRATAGGDTVGLRFSRPSGLGANGQPLASIDGGDEAVSLLGVGFALRLARNLAVELGGNLSVERDGLTLRLPAAAARQDRHAAR